MTLTMTQEAPETEPSRQCLCGCERPLEASSGRGRPTLYASPECRRRIEYRARRANRADVRSPKEARDSRAGRETLGVRIADPAKLARNWFTWRYPAHYQPAGDGRNPAGFRSILAAGSYPAVVRGIHDGFTVRSIRGSDVEVTEIARFIRHLPRFQQADLACRAIEARLSRPLLEESPDKRVSHDALDRRPDPLTLADLRAFYVPGQCLEGGCDGEVHGDGLCRKHYDQYRR